MHVALVCPYSLDTPGGVATHVMGLATWLASQGHHADVIAPGTRSRATPEGVTLHLVGRAHDFRFNGSVAQLAVGSRQCRDAIRVSREADVVHVHEPLTPGVAHAVARASAHLVVTHHASFHAHPIVTRLLRRRAAQLRPAAVIAVSRAAQGTASAVTGWGPVVIANGVSMPKPPPARTGWRGGEYPRVGFLGRLDEPRKGFAVFRDLATMASASGLDAEFVAIGPGGVAAGPVRLIGPVDDTTRDRALHDLDVLVAPNLFGESFGLILVEALAAGCAVVASDLPGFRDVLDAAATGTFFVAGDARSALGALQEVLERPPNPVRLHDAARRWDWATLGPLVLAQYEGALASGDALPSAGARKGHGLGWSL